MAHTDDQILFLRLVLRAWIAYEFQLEVPEENLETFLVTLQDEEALYNDASPKLDVCEGVAIVFYPDHKPGFYVYYVDGERYRRDYSRTTELNRLIRPNPVMIGSPSFRDW